MSLSLTLPRWYDLHAHFRQGDMMPSLIKDHLSMGCAGILAMPNTKPPVGKIFKADSLPYWSIEEYRDMLLAAGGDAFDKIIVPLYLTKDTTPAMIKAGAKAGILEACKYYPPHGTTGAEFGYPFEKFIENGVFAAMRDHGIILCVHGEEHALPPETYFARGTNAEEIFYTERLPRAVESFPDLKIVGEHVTTKIAVDFIQSAPATVAASVTPQHLLYTVGHLLQGLKYHLYCLPLLKFKEDRAALRAAVIDPDNVKFFAGTDSAPHAQKVTECGCAAGCYTGGIAPQLYAQAFEEAGIELKNAAGVAAFRKFLCEIGPEFYRIKSPTGTFTFLKNSTSANPLTLAYRE
ncbi:MAG: dihydroorotase [Alphaproteobacteria bacterium]|nr:dihydroorotase [Alphaproteobacteria bacterium]